MVTVRTTLQVDPVTSARLGKIRQRGTGAELLLRKSLHATGHRFRVENRDLPGSPDIANRHGKWAIFVHGCFWHRHGGCERASTPKRNRAFWIEKFERNVERDARVEAALRERGWLVLVEWECEIEADARTVGRRVASRIDRWLRGGQRAIKKRSTTARRGAR